MPTLLDAVMYLSLTRGDAVLCPSPVPLLVSWFPWAENKDPWLAPVISRPGNWDFRGVPSDTAYAEPRWSLQYSKLSTSLLTHFFLSSTVHQKHRLNIP